MSYTSQRRSLQDSGLATRFSAMRDISLRAGDTARTGFESDFDIDMKGPQDFLTEYDLKVETLIREQIDGLFPGDDILGEEKGGTVSDSYWLIDPIDGTANFARGIPHYCVVLTYVAKNRVALGCIYDPSHDELFLAADGQGATKNGVPISVSSISDPAMASIEMGWSQRRSNEAYLNGVRNLLDLGFNVRRTSCGALGQAYVADGRSDGYAELHMNPWDCLAGLLLIREAGGRVGGAIHEPKLAKGGAVLGAAPALAVQIGMAVGLRAT